MKKSRKSKKEIKIENRKARNVVLGQILRPSFKQRHYVM